MAKSRASATNSLLTAVLLLPLLVGCGSAELGNEQAIGQLCDLTFTAPLEHAAYNASAAECPSHICLKPVQSPRPLYPATVATCSGECTQDSDCEGELRDVTNPADARCRTGFSCAVPFEVGPLACKKLCVCKDFFAPERAAPPPPVACQATAPAGLSSDVTGVGETEDVAVSVPLLRKVDMAILVDNSPTMGPKIEKFTRAFPKMLGMLKSPEDDRLPDLRLTILDSDLGTGGAYLTGSCGPKTLPDGTTSLLGDMGRLQMLTAPTACTFTAGSRFLEHSGGSALNYSGDLAGVFSCLVGNLGTAGCADIQPLGAFERALTPKGLGNEAQQAAFLRPEAELALILLTDKDDCSASPNDGLFGDKPELRGESRSLRCATRSHLCGGIPLADDTPGYPTRSPFTHAFSECGARLDACPSTLDYPTGTDTSVPTNCSPLRHVKDMTTQIHMLKARPGQIVVAGFLGWPLDGDMASAQYKIAPVPNPNPTDAAHPTVFDSWPICYDPNHLPSPATTDPATGFDATAAAWGATPGLRAAAFIDEFDLSGFDKGHKFSVCQPDFSKSMESIGTALASKLENLCVGGKLVDLDPVAPGIQPNCRVAFRTPVRSGTDYVEQPSLPRCAAQASDGNVVNVVEDCWQLITNNSRCPSGQKIDVLRTASELASGPLPDGTKLRFACQVCPTMNAGSAVPPGCAY